MCTGSSCLYRMCFQVAGCHGIQQRRTPIWVWIRMRMWIWICLRCFKLGPLNYWLIWSESRFTLHSGINKLTSWMTILLCGHVVASAVSRWFQKAVLVNCGKRSVRHVCKISLIDTFNVCHSFNTEGTITSIFNETYRRAQIVTLLVVKCQNYIFSVN